MGLMDRIRSAGSSSDADAGMASRLDKVSRLSVEHVDIPTEFRPTDLEAWLFAPPEPGWAFSAIPRPVRARIRYPSLVDMVKDRFERLETAMDLMEANIKMTAQQTAKIAAESVTVAPAAPSSGDGGGDVIHTVGADGEVTSRPVEGTSDTAAPSTAGLAGGPGLLDLYEAQSLAVNPFLKSSEADALMHGPSMDPTKIVALLLDHLSGSDTLSFLRRHPSQGNHSLRREGASSNSEPRRPWRAIRSAPSVNNRTLLTFAAMIEAWRTQGTP